MFLRRHNRWRAGVREVLIANRGEIAIRVARTLREMGINGRRLHGDRSRRPARASCRRGLPDRARGAYRSYLDIAKMIDVAKEAGRGRNAPRYGFLGENAELARGCAEAGSP